MTRIDFFFGPEKYIITRQCRSAMAKRTQRENARGRGLCSEVKMRKLENRDHRKNRRNGYSILEVIAVLLVLSVIAVVAVSRFTSTTHYNVAAETEILKANIRYAQFRALSDADTASGANNVTWGISLSGNAYTLQRNRADATTSFPGENSPTHNLPSGISVTAGTVTYNVWGIPVDSADVPLAGNLTILVSDGASSQTITVTRNTGFIP